MITKAVLKTHIPRKNLLLPELIIVMFFFSLAAAGCVKLFGLAYEDVNYSRALTSAVIETQSVAECFKAADGDLEKTAELLGLPSLHLIRYDTDWNLINPAVSGTTDDRFYIIIQTEEANGLITAIITAGAFESDKIIYELKAAVPKAAEKEAET